MKKIIFISALALLAIACHKEPYPPDSDNEYLVYTAPAKGVDFTQYTTFDIPDSLLIIGHVYLTILLEHGTNFHHA